MIQKTDPKRYEEFEVSIHMRAVISEVQTADASTSRYKCEIWFLDHENKVIEPSIGIGVSPPYVPRNADSTADFAKGEAYKIALRGAISFLARQNDQQE